MMGNVMSSVVYGLYERHLRPKYFRAVGSKGISSPASHNFTTRNLRLLQGDNDAE